MLRMRRLAFIAALLAGLASPAWADHNVDIFAAMSDGGPLTDEQCLQADGASEPWTPERQRSGKIIDKKLVTATHIYVLYAHQAKGLIIKTHALMYCVFPRADLDPIVTAYQHGDYATALREWRPLAEQGHPLAQFNLSFMYSEGRGVTKDPVQSHMWMSLASSKLPPGKSREDAIKALSTLAKWMTPAQIAEAQRLTREWLEKHPNH